MYSYYKFKNIYFFIVAIKKILKTLRYTLNYIFKRIVK